MDQDPLNQGDAPWSTALHPRGAMGCRACSAGFKHWAVHCTAQGSACCAPRYTRAREKMSNFLFLFFEFWQTIFYLNFTTKGYPLRHEITGVCYGEVSMKCHIFSCFLSFFVKNG